MPWADALANARLPLDLKRVSRSDGEARAADALARLGLGRFSTRLSPRIVRRHEDARLDRPRAGGGAATAADGRAFRGAGRTHPPEPERRSADAVARRRHHRDLRHPQRDGSQLSVGSRAGDVAAPGPHQNRDRVARRSARPSFALASRKARRASRLHCWRRHDTRPQHRAPAVAWHRLAGFVGMDREGARHSALCFARTQRHHPCLDRRISAR